MKRFFFIPLCALLLVHCSKTTQNPTDNTTETTKESRSMTDIRNDVVETVKTKSQIAPGVDIDNEPIQPLEIPKDLNSKKVALGKLLFHDTRLSTDNTLSCASCHDLGKGGTDISDVSTGVNGILGPINSPTVFNSGFNFVQFWDGRAKTLEEQAEGPVHNPKEMGSNWKEVLAKLTKDDTYPGLFKELYPDGITGKNIANAIAEFERSLVTVNSRFDQYLKGKKDALTALEKQGYELFKGYGCVTCHNGPAMGGNSFQRYGLFEDYFKTKSEITEADLGVYNVTKNEADKHWFKVPSLRVAALTPPYFHDASAKTLEDAIKAMGYYQLGAKFTDDELKAISAFLKSVVGDYEGKPLLQP